MDSFAITEGLVAQEPQESQSEPIDSKLSEETNKFQRAIAAWRGRKPSSDMYIKSSSSARLTPFYQESI